MSGTKEPGMYLPDYDGGSIANLMASIAQACGGRAGACPPLAELPPARLARVSNLVLLVVDGLGYDLLAERPGRLGPYLRGHLTSVFPSTTASAIPTFMTGLPPSQHGLTGWHMWLREVGGLLAILPLSARPGAPLAAPLPPRGELPEHLFAHDTLYQGLGRTSYVVSPHFIADSPFNRYHSRGAVRLPYAGLEGLFGALDQLNTKAGNKFVYAYWPDYDSTAHQYGCRSPQALAALDAFAAAFAAWLERVRDSDTLVLVTADHGFIDSPPQRQLDLADHPLLAECLALPLCGEHRAAWCYLKPGKAPVFEAYVRRHLEHAMVALPRERLLAEGWFGPGPAHPELAARIGDYALLLRDDWTLHDTLPGEK
ncbi:MAG TPA: alkaline phosphatase family protein, partial [Azospira sp.]|nr:alkaline phosphatase family protein [Azospira sp.]